MKRVVWLVLALALCLPVLTRCGQPQQVDPPAFDALARWVPGDATQVFFLDLKPGGEAGRHWQRIRQKLESNPAGQEALESLLSEFRVWKYGREEYLEGPVVSGSHGGASYNIAQVSDEQAIADALLQDLEDVEWEQSEYEGKTLYAGRHWAADAYSQNLAWTVHDGHLFLTSRYDGKPVTQLQELLSLPEEESLASLPSWRALGDRLPSSLMGLIFLNTAADARRNLPPPGDMSLGEAFYRQLEAVALAALPEQEGMHVQVVGTFTSEVDVPPQLQALFDLPAVDPAAWTALPGDTALALVAHDASLLWPWFQELFTLNEDSLALLRDAVGLDLEADLFGAEGPLTGDLALGITPPLPDQPISEGLTAAQLLILARGASQAQADGVRTAMESRGTVFGPGEVEGVALQTQVGTAPTGYAISYGFDGDTLFLGSSPDVIGQGIAAQRDGDGMVTTAAFRAVRETLPDRPTLIFYLNPASLTDIARANMTEEQYQRSQEFLLMEAFEAIGGGLRLQPERLDGVLYFLVTE